MYYKINILSLLLLSNFQEKIITTVPQRLQVNKLKLLKRVISCLKKCSILRILLRLPRPTFYCTIAKSFTSFPFIFPKSTTYWSCLFLDSRKSMWIENWELSHYFLSNITCTLHGNWYVGLHTHVAWRFAPN